MACLLLLLASWGCGQKEETAEGKSEDKVKKAVRDVVRKEFDYYEGAKQKLGETEKKEQERREQEKELN